MIKIIHTKMIVVAIAIAFLTMGFSSIGGLAANNSVELDERIIVIILRMKLLFFKFV